jgi:hypothetical protein
MLLAALPYNNTAMDANMITVRLLDVLKHERMVAQFTQLHDGVHEGLSSALPLFSFLRPVSQKDSFALHVAATQTVTITITQLLQASGNATNYILWKAENPKLYV